MAEVVDRSSDHHNTGSVVAWVALVISVIALILAWVAYNRTGEDLEQRIQEGIEQSAIEAGEAVEEAGDAAQEGAQEAGEAAQEGTDAVEEGIDEGPDGTDDGTQ